MKKILLKSCRLFDYSENQDILIHNGKIDKIGLNISDNDAEVIDIQGNLVVPGFIDLHIHGAGGGEVFKAEFTDLNKMTTTLVQYGVTGILPTFVVNPANNYQQLHQLKEIVHMDYSGSRILGLHLEGPSINMKRKGGIPVTNVIEYSRSELLKIINILGDDLKMMTIAPEISPNMEIIEILVDNGIVPALGHTDISYENAHQAFDRGIKHVTHIFNAMPSLHHREPGPLLAVLERKDISVQIISDGVHLNPAIVKYLYNTLGIDNCVCVSDGQSVIGLPDGQYDINGGIYLKNGEKTTDIDGNLIGTALDVGTIAKKFQSFTDCTFQKAIQSVTLNPAKALSRQDSVGSIVEGNFADLVILDKDNNIYKVMIDGKILVL